MAVTGIIVLFVALIFLFISGKNLLARSLRKRQCTATVTGEVCEVKEKTRGASSDSGVSTTEYVAYVQYAVDGVTYNRKFEKSYKSGDFWKGKAVEVQYDPKKPSVINARGKSQLPDLVLLGIGVVAAIVGVVLFFIGAAA